MKIYTLTVDIVYYDDEELNGLEGLEQLAEQIRDELDADEVEIELEEDEEE